MSHYPTTRVSKSIGFTFRLFTLILQRAKQENKAVSTIVNEALCQYFKLDTERELKNSRKPKIHADLHELFTGEELQIAPKAKNPTHAKLDDIINKMTPIYEALEQPDLPPDEEKRLNGLLEALRAQAAEVGND